MTTPSKIGARAILKFHGFLRGCPPPSQPWTSNYWFFSVYCFATWYYHYHIYKVNSLIKIQFFVDITEWRKEKWLFCIIVWMEMFRFRLWNRYFGQDTGIFSHIFSSLYIGHFWNLCGPTNTLGKSQKMEIMEILNRKEMGKLYLSLLGIIYFYKIRIFIRYFSNFLFFTLNVGW